MKSSRDSVVLDPYVNKMATIIQNYSKSKQDSSYVSDCLWLESFSATEVSVWCNKFKDGWTAPSYNPLKHRDRPRPSHNDEHCVIVGGLIGRSKSQTSWSCWSDRYCKSPVHESTSLGKEHYHEGMFKLAKQWNTCLNANGDYVKK
jgi:hypothetical protein